MAKRTVPSLYFWGVLSLAGLMAAPAPAAEAAAARRPNLLMIMVDTLRADRLSAYGYRRPTSPTVERLARRGVLFLDATSDSPWTKPAVTSLFTGLYPALHQVLESPRLRSGTSDALAPSAITLAERLAEAGYHTLAVSGNPHVQESTGLLQGFQRSFNPGSMGPAERVHFQALTLLAADRIEALGWPALVASPHNAIRPAGAEPIQRLTSTKGGAKITVGQASGLEPGALYVVGGRYRGGDRSFGFLVSNQGGAVERLAPPGAESADIESWVTGWSLVAAAPDSELTVQGVFGQSRGSVPQQLEVTDLVVLPLSALAAEGSAPIFLYLHIMDIHAPYRPPKPLSKAYLEEPDLDPTPVPGKLLNRQIAVKDERRLGAYSALYDAQINDWDQQLGDFLERVAPLLKPEETVLVLTADHGEGFLEHGLMNHGNSVYQELLWVPLLLAGPGVPAGPRIAAPVALVDVLPTALALLGLPIPERLSGTDLEPLWRNSDNPGMLAERSLYAFLKLPMQYGIVEWLVLRRGPWKLIHARGAQKGSSLFHLGRDPAERHDLAGAEPQQATRMSEELVRWQNAMAAEGAELALALPQQLLKEERERLEALGYGR